MNLKINIKNEKKLPRPKHWSGWCLNPLQLNFGWVINIEFMKD